MSPLPIQAAAVMAFTAVAMGWDLRTRRIPNLLNVASLGLALAWHASVGGWNGFLFSLGGFATGFGILFVLWLIGGGGGGDVKLMGAVGAWLGPQLTMIAFVASGVIVVLCQCVTVMWKAGRGSPLTPGENPPAATPTTDSAEHPVDATGLASDSTKPPAVSPGHRNKLPYAVPVALAVWGLMGLKLFKMLSDK